MGLSHRRLPVHGVQFHLESIASEHGHLMLKNFLDIAASWNSSTGRRGAVPTTPPKQRRHELRARP
jgi:anthranilate synthase component II